jgi:hypothetical protein
VFDATPKKQNLASALAFLLKASNDLNVAYVVVGKPAQQARG